MADEPEIHPDTEDWLERRNKFRDDIAAALSGKIGDEDDEDDEEDDGGEDGDDGEGEDDDSVDESSECTVPGRRGDDPVVKEGGDPGRRERQAACDIGAAMRAIDRIECMSGPWPPSEGLYNALLSSLESESDVAPKQVAFERQVNVLESYRKMLLHKKQRVCHYIAAWCDCMANEAQSQEELRELLLFRPIGRVADVGDDGG